MGKCEAKGGESKREAIFEQAFAFKECIRNVWNECYALFGQVKC